MHVLKALIVTAALAIAPAALAQSAGDLSGAWQGVFWGPQTAPATFDASLIDQPGPGFSGSAVERATFGNNESPFLLSGVEGEVRNGRIRFVKTYDGTGGVTHSVAYEGQIVSGRRIVGTWQVDGAQGQFELVR